MTLVELQNTKRKTGRTDRLIDEALRLSGGGKAVYIITQQATELQSRIDRICPNSGIKCEPVLPVHFDWFTMRPVGARPNCVWLVDHYIVESDWRFRAMFDAMTQFDEEG